MEKRVVLGEMIEKNMRKHNLTMKELGEKVGKTESSVSYWISGKSIPRMGVIQKLSDLFNISTDELVYGNNCSVSDRTTKSRSVKIPVLGKVVAGVPIEAIEEILDYEEIDENMARTGEYFALQIKGDSMEPRMIEGDVVIVRKQEMVNSGDVAIVLVNGDEATVKRVRILENGIMLIPFNTKYTPWEYNADQCESLPVSIIGKVVELRGKF